MTNKEERQERSRVRAEEYQRKRRTRLIVFISALSLYILVPLVFWGGVEYGLWHPIRTSEFRSSLSLATPVLLLTILYFGEEFFFGKRKDSKEKGSAVKQPEPAAQK